MSISEARSQGKNLPGLILEPVTCPELEEGSLGGEGRTGSRGKVLGLIKAIWRLSQSSCGLYVPDPLP